MKDDKSYSWVSHTRKLLRKYLLPDPLTIIEMRYSKISWKRMVKKNVYRVWSHHLEMEAIEKSTLIFCKNDFEPNVPHQSLQNLENNFEIKKANIKWRIQTGTYSTQSRRFTYRQIPSPNCLLCSSNQKEDLKHFILECSGLEDERKKLLPKIIQIVPLIYTDVNELHTNSEILLKFIIDHSHPDVQAKFPMPASYNHEIERSIRQFLFKIHECRINRINTMSL